MIRDIEKFVDDCIHNTCYAPCVTNRKSNRMFVVIREDGWFEPMRHVRKTLEGIIRCTAKDSCMTARPFTIIELDLTKGKVVYDYREYQKRKHGKKTVKKTNRKTKKANR